MPESYELSVNGKSCSVQAEGDTPLLYILRNDLKLKGARYGCGVGQCGACAVIMDGKDIFSCDTPLWAVAGKSITTVEGLGTRDKPHALQQAFIDEQAAQCGYCITGIIMAAKALLDRTAHPTDAEIDAALERHLCRCGTHNRIRRAIHRAAQALGEDQ
ncbi:MAG: 2Fe-2S iron-sulfur cluster binding domain-containing protein [Betaproteobacteria bacterium]|nr:2Fe-2S iron-sulfur cluster binding domain-containing protein [Betaproteobacteria bacterium]